jgi:hypothetical protein
MIEAADIGHSPAIVVRGDDVDGVDEGEQPEQGEQHDGMGWDGSRSATDQQTGGKEIGRREEIGNRTEDLSFSCGMQSEPYVVSAHCNTVLVRPPAGLLQVLLGTRGFSSQVLQHLNPLARCPCAVMPQAHRSSRSGTPGETFHTPIR